MNAKSRYVPRNYRWFNKLLKWTLGAWLRRAYRVESRGGEFLKTLKPPFIVVANHVTTRDPFILGPLIRQPVYWVTGDGAMRTPLLGKILRFVGSIPKTKAIPDMQTINWIVEVTRKRKGVVGVFPEGQATWDGRSLPVLPATAKLLKLLKIPVVAARISGGYSSLPRWTWKRRPGRFVVDWKLALEPAELKTLAAEEIVERLESAIGHDECAYLEAEPQEFESRRMAEHLELSLFMCPACGSIGRLKSFRSRFNCLACGEALALDGRYRFRRLGGGEPAFPTIRDWDAWQEKTFAAAAARAAAERPEAPFLSDPGALLLRGRKTRPLRRVRAGTLLLYRDRLELATHFGSRLSFPLAEIEGANVYKRNLLEFYVGRTLFQVRFPLRATSARKWCMGIEALKAP